MPPDEKSKAIAACILIGLLMCSHTAKAQEKTQSPDTDRAPRPTASASDIEAGRRKALALIRDETAAAVDIDRENCAMGRQVEIVRRARARGDQYTPDASQTCPEVIKRQDRDGTALNFYGRIAKSGDGAMTPALELDSVVKAASQNESQVPIGNGKAIEMTLALSFDAGYTLGLREGLTLASFGVADTPDNTRKVRDVAEICLGAENNQAITAKICYLVGLELASKDNTSNPVRPRASHSGLPAEIARERMEFLDLLEGNSFSLADWRYSCASGKEVGKVRDQRASSDLITPDASETCPLVIKRQVHDGTALDYYAKLVADGQGSITPQVALENTAKAAMGNQPVVAIGNGRGFKLTNPIAFDAGYTTGLIDTTTTAESLGLSDSQTNIQKLKELAESCLDGGNKEPLKASACYVAGLALAAQNKRLPAAK